MANARPPPPACSNAPAAATSRIMSGGPDDWAAGHGPRVGGRRVTPHARTTARSGSACGSTSPSSACSSRSTPSSAGCSARNAPSCRCSPSEVFGLPRLHRRADVHRRVRDRQGGDELLRRHPVRPLRPQAGAGRRMAGRPPGAAAADLGADLGVGGVRQRPARHQPGPDLVHHRGDEDRPRRPGPPRARDGLQRGRRLRRGRADRDGHRLPRRGRTVCGLHRSTSASPSPPSAWGSPRCSCGRPASTPGSRPRRHVARPTAATTTSATT